jgi:hypothetical protein
MVSAVLHLALFIGGIVVALMLRRRDSMAALLTALGFGCVLLSSMIVFGEGFAASRIVSAAPSGAQVQMTFLVIGIMITLIELAGLMLIFLGLLRMVRRRGPVVPGTGAGR